VVGWGEEMRARRCAGGRRRWGRGFADAGWEAQRVGAPRPRGGLEMRGRVGGAESGGVGRNHHLFTGGISLMNSGCRFAEDADSYLVDPARSHMLVSKIKAGETSGRGGSAP
jgi:hypothetical protein